VFELLTLRGTPPQTGPVSLVHPYPPRKTSSANVRWVAARRVADSYASRPADRSIDHVRLLRILHAILRRDAN
jgi:hypothetical protein